MIPLVLLIVFNRFVIDTVKLDVPTAMFISFTVALCCELAARPSRTYSIPALNSST